MYEIKSKHSIGVSYYRRYETKESNYAADLIKYDRLYKLKSFLV